MSASWSSIDSRPRPVPIGAGKVLLSPIIGVARKYDPDREVLGELVIAVRCMRRREHHVARSDHGDRDEFYIVASGTARYRWDGGETMRHLWTGGRPRREANPDVVVAEHLGGAAALGRLQRTSGGERYWRWRMIHELPPCFSLLPSSRFVPRQEHVINRIIT
jgi:hypothetical protein